MNFDNNNGKMFHSFIHHPLRDEKKKISKSLSFVLLFPFIFFSTEFEWWMCLCVAYKVVVVVVVVVIIVYIEWNILNEMNAVDIGERWKENNLWLSTSNNGGNRFFFFSEYFENWIQVNCIELDEKTCWLCWWWWWWWIKDYVD